jgi:predicted nucleic-acid-binding Zn-ribbon protein
MSELFCPKCGNHSVENEEEAMEGVYNYHRHYCQECGCSFKVLRKSRVGRGR